MFLIIGNFEKISDDFFVTREHEKKTKHLPSIDTERIQRLFVQNNIVLHFLKINQNNYKISNFFQNMKVSTANLIDSSINNIEMIHNLGDKMNKFTNKFGKHK